LLLCMNDPCMVGHIWKWMPLQEKKWNTAIGINY